MQGFNNIATLRAEEYTLIGKILHSHTEDMLLVSGLITLLLCSTSYGSFQWISTPQDVYVLLGATAVFPCNYSGSSQVPYWNINNSHYFFNELPPRHYYNPQRRTLYIYNVNLFDNQTSFQCTITDHQQQRISTTGVLHVIRTVPSTTVASASASLELWNLSESVTTTTKLDSTPRVRFPTTVIVATALVTQPKASLPLDLTKTKIVPQNMPPFVSYMYVTSRGNVAFTVSNTASITAETGGAAPSNTSSSFLAYAVLFSAAIMSTTLICIVSIILIAVIIHKHRHHHVSNSSRGYPNAALTETETKCEDPSWYKANEAYDTGLLKHEDPKYEEINV